MSLYELNNISHHYNGRPVLSIDQWSLPAGAITGLIGPNGGGKSTLLKLLGFVERPVTGDIYFNGQRTAPFSGLARDQVALLPQESYLLKRSVRSNVAYGLRNRNKGIEVNQRVPEALTLVGLEPDRFARRAWFALSGGEARRVALAARLVLHPRVLLLDEPTTSVDAASALDIKAAALHAHRQWGTSLIIASHDLPWLYDICDNVVHLFQGRILGKGQQTMLFGPWQRMDHQRVCTALSNEQQFVALQSSADSGRTVAVVDPTHLALCQPDGLLPEDKARLEGILVSLGLNKPSGRINAAVMVGHTVFNLLVDPASVSTHALTPGRKVRITYAPEEIKWY